VRGSSAGEELVIDVSRHDEDSRFAGDDILADIGTVTIDGSTLSADGLTVRNSSDGSEVSGSVRIDCCRGPTRRIERRFVPGRSSQPRLPRRALLWRRGSNGVA
jgi:hypothetical protein